MAIQFNCPYCTSSIRVGDEAAGKIGRCPKCEQRLRVPPVAPPAGPPPAGSTPADSAPTPADPPAVTPAAPFSAAPDATDNEVEFPDLTAGASPTFGTETEEPSPALPGVPVIPGAETPSYASRLKRRRRSSGWIIPVLLGAVLLGAFGLYWKMTEVTATGPLPCTVLPADHTLQITLDVTEHGVSTATAQAVVEHLREQPVSLVTDLMITEFSGNARGLQITLTPGVNGRLVQVPILKNRAVADFYAENLEQLDKDRRRELDTAVRQFCEIWATATETGMNPRELTDFRNRLALPAMVRGLGYHVNAVVDRRRYPCVHEDSDTRLHFMLPLDTDSFEIIARPFEDRRPVLPQPFGFQVQVPQQEPEPASDDGADEVDASPEDAETIDEATDSPGEEEPDGATMPAGHADGEEASMTPPGTSPPASD